MKKVISFDFESIRKVLEEESPKGLYEKKAIVPKTDKLRKALEETTKFNDFTYRSVLGIDIYQYSQYESLEQTLVPFLFKLIYKEVATLCLEQAGFVFQKYKVDTFDKAFINTGDGGFQIFETPLHAIVYAIHFELVVRYYNAYQFYPKLRRMIGPLNLRYAMTRDHVYRFEDNFYGPSIINNNRILDKDSLNRFLIDENTFKWFMLKMSGVENLQFISLEEIKRISEFNDYEIEKRSNLESIFPDKMDFKYRRIISTDIQKIGKIRVKSTALSIYNLHIQYVGGMKRDDERTLVTLSLGNLNTSGISPE
jgi:hypothetical protein